MIDLVRLKIHWLLRHFFQTGKLFAHIFSGPEVCETVYESECETSYHEHEVEEDTPSCRIMQVKIFFIPKIPRKATTFTLQIRLHLQR